MDTSQDIMLGLLSEGGRERIKADVAVATDYIRARYLPWKDCRLADLEAWLTWHWIQGLVGAVSDVRSGDLAAVVVVRFLDELDEFETVYRHSPEGKICWVELAVSESQAAFRAAVSVLRLLHEAPECLAFKRDGRRGKPRLYLWKNISSKWESIHGKF